jgi:hypothetical protein
MSASVVRMRNDRASYNGVTIVYSGVPVVLHWCYSYAAVVLLEKAQDKGQHVRVCRTHAGR